VTGPTSQPAAETAFRKLQLRARATNLARVARLAGAVEAAAGGMITEEDRRSALDLAHQIVGSAGTFGYPRASGLAGQLEKFFVTGGHDADQVRLARGWLDSLRAALEGDPEDDD
jgi:hypothetical protein